MSHTDIKNKKKLRCVKHMYISMTLFPEVRLQFFSDNCMHIHPDLNVYVCVQISHMSTVQLFTSIVISSEILGPLDNNVHAKLKRNTHCIYACMRTKLEQRSNNISRKI